MRRLAQHDRTLLLGLEHDGPAGEDVDTLGEAKKAKVPGEGGRRSADNSTPILATDRHEVVMWFVGVAVAAIRPGSLSCLE